MRNFDFDYRIAQQTRDIPKCRLYSIPLFKTKTPSTMNDKKQGKSRDKKNAPLKRKLSTDPQEKMKGPVSSTMQTIKEAAEEHGGEKKDQEQ